MSKSNYNSLNKVLREAYLQASEGKGRERHASGQPFGMQPICELTRKVGLGFALGQAMKKIEESQRLPGEHGVAELLGAINYLAAAIIIRRELAAAAAKWPAYQLPGDKQDD